MEMAADHPGQLGPDLDVVTTDDLFNVSRDDEFDFEIGAEGDLVVIEDGDKANNNPGSYADEALAYDGESYTQQDHEEDFEALPLQSYDEDGQELTNEGLGLQSAVNDTTNAPVDIPEAQNDTYDIGREDDSEHPPEGAYEEVYHEEAVELDNFENASQGHDHGDDTIITATSVDVVQYEEADFADSALEAETNQKEQAGRSIPDDESHAPQTDQDIHLSSLHDKTAAEYDDDTHGQDETFVTAVEDDHDSRSSAELLTENGNSSDVVEESLELTNWEGIGNDDDHLSDARPNVTVAYRGQEYFLFAESSDEDPNTYFLDETDSIHRSLSEFLGNVRNVISAEVEAGDEVFVKIDGLGLEFGESTAKDFLEGTTLDQLIQVNNKLVQYDGGSQSPELYIYLSTRSNPVHRFAELVKGVEEGQGLTHFEKYYDDPSAKSSAANEDDQFEHNVLSDDLSPEEVYDGSGEMIDDGGEPLEAEEQPLYHNPFRVETETENEALDAGAKSEATIGHSASAQANDELAEDWDEDNRVEGLGERGSAEDAINDVETQVDNLTQEEHEHTDGENTFPSRRSKCLGPDSCLCDNCYESGFQDVAGGRQPSVNVTQRFITAIPSSGTQPMVKEAWENLMFDDYEAGTAANKGTQDFTADAVDDDFLDLGDSGNHEQNAADPTGVTRNGSVVELDAARQASYNSSATGTLDGDDSRHEDEANALQRVADSNEPQQQTELDIPQPEGDEIDWNHDDENDGGAVDQNLTDSPSSLSGKRSRQEDGALDGLGDENGKHIARFCLTSAC